MKAIASRTPPPPHLAAHARARPRRSTARLAVVDRTMAAGEMTPLHVHDEDEVISVLAGALTLHVAGESIRLEAGDAHVAPRGVPHAAAAGSAGVRYRAATHVASAARYEDFLRAAARPAAPALTGRRAWPSMEEAATLAAIAGANRITVLAPPGALPETGERVA